MGGSYAQALRLNVGKIIGWARDEHVARHAIDEKYIDDAVGPGDLAQQSDLLILAMPPAVCGEYLSVYRQLCRPGTVITDVAGVKTGVLAQTMGCDVHGVDFVGGHPLCGREGKGLIRARGEVFLGGDYVVTPVASNQEFSLDLVKKMAMSIGCRRVLNMSPERHDRIVAATSQLPHIFACMLTMSAANFSQDVFTGGSYRDASRVADINPELWTELCLANREALQEVLDLVEVELKNCRAALDLERAGQLTDFFERGRVAWQEVDDNVTRI
jgi:prephenate dehydrogenase